MYVVTCAVRVWPLPTSFLSIFFIYIYIYFFFFSLVRLELISDAIYMDVIVGSNLVCMLYDKGPLAFSEAKNYGFILDNHMDDGKNNIEGLTSLKPDERWILVVVLFYV